MGRMPKSAVRLAVLCGGESAEREVSLASGACVTATLEAAGHECQVIDPAEHDLSAIAWDRFDACFLALHGGAGEDGRIQRDLERWQVCYTGSGPTASHRAMNKSVAKALFRRAGIPTPEYVVLHTGFSHRAMAEQVARLGFPLVVKPDSQGSSLGVAAVQYAAELPARVAQTARFGSPILVERLIVGREFTQTVLGRRPLPLLEIVGQKKIFDYESKYSSSLIEHHFDTGLPPIKIKEFQQTAVAAAAVLGTSGLIRVDMMLDTELRPWVLEINTLPGMTEHSLAPKAARQAGIDMPNLCNSMLRDGLRKGRLLQEHRWRRTRTDLCTVRG